MRLALFDPQSDSSGGELTEKGLAYSKEKHPGALVLQLPSNYSAASAQNSKQRVVPFAITETLKNQLLILSEQQNAGVFIILLTTYKVMLYRYSGRNELGVATADLNEQEQIDSTQSIRIKALLSDLDGERVFTELVQQLKSLVASQSYQSSDSIRFSTGDEGKTGTKPALKELFIFQNQSQTVGANNGVPESAFKMADFDVMFQLTDTGDCLQGHIKYSTEVYSPEIIERMAGHYLQLLQSVVDTPQQKIGSLPMLTAEEQYALLYKFNDTLTAYSKEQTLAGLFEDQVLKTPDNIALMQDNLTMSYRRLNERANQLARYLVEKGVKSGDNIGLLVTRSFDMITGMYAIMKAGGAYVPVDPEYPMERQEYILSKSGVDLVIADDDYPLTKRKANFKVVNFNKIDLNAYESSNPELPVDSGQLAYTIYTSGSTGSPKGVMIEHHSAVNLIEWVNREFKVGAHDRLLFLTSMCFDLSVYDVFGILAAGGSIVIVKQQEVVDVGKLKNLLQYFKITFWDSVPTTMNYLVKELLSGHSQYKQTDLRLVFMSGDWIPVRLPDEIRRFFPNAEVISLGGATEGTVWSNYYPVKTVQKSWNSIPYGKPISNNFFYVLNEQLQPVPAGVPGELFIGGTGVARGYANDREKTDYSFIDDPFNDTAGGRMYRTGDLGRMLPDGNLEFLGRKDTQVKIRGYRVELGEIESVLNQCFMVNQAVVIARPDKEGNKLLIGYIVPEKTFDRKAIASYLKHKLPDYMIPALLTELEKFPQSSNGKIDRKALSDLEIPEQQHTDFQKPETENQRKVAGIWQEILGLEKVGIHDNFFELGGHSLIAVRMITRLEKEIGVKLPLAILFKYPTIDSLVSFIEKENKDLNTTWRSLVPIKAAGTKMPVYIIHGSGLNVLSFSDIAMYVDDDQPVFGLQAKGLNGIEEASDDMTEIAKAYVAEILEHNPSGPYAIAGYSFGGYVAVEIRNQLELMGKEVKMLAIFDTNAVDSGHYKLSTKIKRQFPKLIWFLKSLIQRPGPTLSYQQFLLRKSIKNISTKIMGSTKVEANDYYNRLEEINRKHWQAFRRYNLRPFNDVIYLFRAQERIYFVDDFKYLGWNKFAKKGVRVYEVSGDHRTMLLPPHAKKFAHALQEALDNC